MMTRMRQMTKSMFVLVGLAFIGLIVFEWGADFSGGGPDTTVGVVNGTKLSYSEFNNYYQQLYQNVSTQSQGKVDESQLSDVRNQVWENFIQRTLLQEQMEDLNISVSDSEIVYHIYNFPIEDFQKNPNLQTNGIFDINKYRDILTTLPVDQQLLLENFYRSQIPFQKLQNIITNSIRVSESEVMDEFVKQNIKAKVDFLAIRPARFTEGIDVNEDEISNYYEQNIEDFTQEERRELEYVSFNLKPTVDDTNRVFRDIDAIKEELNLGKEFSTLAYELSMDPTVQSNGGDLGYFDENTMVKPFSDAAFAASPGDLVGPIKTIHGYHMIKVEDKKVENGVPKVKASHILLKVAVGSSTRFDKEEEARDFAAIATDNGWDVAVSLKSFEIMSTGFFSEATGTVPGFSSNPAISNFAFTSSEDDISSVYSIDEGFVVLRLKTIQPKGYKQLTDESVKKIIINKVKLEKAKELALSFAQQLDGKVKSKISFKEIADADLLKKVTYQTSNSFSYSQNVSGVGKDAIFAGNAFALEVGETSGLIESTNGFYFQHLLEKTEFDSTFYSNRKSTIKSMLLGQKRQKVFQDWYAELKEGASIKDNRKNFGIY